MIVKILVVVNGVHLRHRITEISVPILNEPKIDFTGTKLHNNHFQSKNMRLDKLFYRVLTGEPQMMIPYMRSSTGIEMART